MPKHPCLPILRGLPVALVLATVGISAVRADSLRWKLTPGETLHYVNEQKTKAAQSVKDRRLEVTQSQTVDMSRKVQSVGADGRAEIVQTIDRMQAHFEAPGHTFNYDSKDPKEPETPDAVVMVPLWKAMIRNPFTLKMNPQGELSDIQVPAELIQINRESFPPGAPGSAMANEEGLKNIIIQAAFPLPPGDVAPGTSWTRQTEVPTPIGVMKQTKTYRYLGPDLAAGPNIAKISMEAKIDFAPKEGVQVPEKIQSQQTQGTFYFDTARGVLTNSEVTEKVTSVINLNDPRLKNAGQPDSVTKNVETTTKMKLVGVDRP